MQRCTETFCHEDWVVDSGCVNSELDEGVIKGVFLRFESCSCTVRCLGEGVAHQGVKVEEDISFPWSLCLAFGAALCINAFSKEEERLVVFAFFVFCYSVDACARGCGCGEPPT